MRGTCHAKGAGIFADYVDAVYRHTWAEPKKMDDPAVICDALLESALPADDILEAAQDPGIKQELLDNTEASVAAGTFGSPSFYVEGELYFGKDKLRDVEEAIARRGAA